MLEHFQQNATSELRREFNMKDFGVFTSACSVSPLFIQHCQEFDINMYSRRCHWLCEIYLEFPFTHPFVAYAKSTISYMRILEILSYLNKESTISLSSSVFKWLLHLAFSQTRYVLPGHFSKSHILVYEQLTFHKGWEVRISWWKVGYLILNIKTVVFATLPDSYLLFNA